MALPRGFRHGPEVVDRLRSLLIERWSYGAIALRMGLTRNAVAGLIHRAGLKGGSLGDRAAETREATRVREGRALARSGRPNGSGDGGSRGLSQAPIAIGRALMRCDEIPAGEPGPLIKDPPMVCGLPWRVGWRSKAGDLIGGCAYIYGHPPRFLWCSRPVCEVIGGEQSESRTSPYCPYHARLCTPGLSVVRRPPAIIDLVQVRPREQDLDRIEAGGAADRQSGPHL